MWLSYLDKGKTPGKRGKDTLFNKWYWFSMSVWNTYFDLYSQCVKKYGAKCQKENIMDFRRQQRKTTS